MSGARRVYILDEAHMLSPSAWNAFLKTLEEPPPHVVFVLATTEAHKVPATIVDRCHRFDFHRPSLEQIAGVLRRVAAEEQIVVPDAAIGMMARSSTGSFRDALGTLEQLVTYGGNEVKLDDVLEVLGVADAELILDTAESLVEHDPKGALLAVERLSASGRDLTQFMKDLAAHLRHLFVVQTLGDVPDSFAVTAEHTERLGQQASRLAQGEVLRAIDLLAAAMSAVKDGSDPRIQLELALLKAVQPQADLSMQALLFRIEQLEAKVGQPAAHSPQPAEQPSAPTPPPTAVAAPRASAPQATAAVAQPQPQAEAAPAPVGEIDLERVRAVWPAVVEEVCKQNGMVGAFLADARPCALEAGRLTVRFPPGGGFAKKKVETNRVFVQDAIAGLAGARVGVVCEVAEATDEEDEVPVAVASVITEEELVERLKGEFGAREVFDDPEES
jgi:DNA polymerase-3 subunit gamma/tau